MSGGEGVLAGGVSRSKRLADMEPYDYTGRGSQRVSEQPPKRIPSPTKNRDLNEAHQRTLELPALERSGGFLERGSLIRLLRGGEQCLVGDDGEIDGIVIVLRARETRGVVREVGFGEIVGGKTLRHLLPPHHALARVRLRERPQMPARPVLRIGCDRARCEVTNHLRTRADQPAVIRKRYNRPCIIGAFSHRPLELRQWISQRLCHARKVSRAGAVNKVRQPSSAQRGSHATTDNARTVNSTLKKNAWKGAGHSVYAPLPFTNCWTFTPVDSTILARAQP